MILKERVSCVVIGAGVIGLAVARSLSKKLSSVLVLEKESSFGKGTSSRNSEVIHSGIYYPTGSVKAKFCAEAARVLYEYCNDRKISYNKCGKLIVATSENESAKLRQLHSQAASNNVRDVRLITADDAKYLEPNVYCTEAIYSPQTGVIDSHMLMQSLLAEAESNGAILCPNTEVLKGHLNSDGTGILETEDASLHCEYVVNCAGLHADDISRRIEHCPTPPKVFFAKGNYFSVEKTLMQPFTHLIYPLPEVGGLGIHATIDLGKKLKFGPDVEWLEPNSGTSNSYRFSYKVEESRAAAFKESITKYWPVVEENVLVPYYAGIRPKVFNELLGDSDFYIRKESKRCVSCYGIESPGLTSCLSIAEHVSNLLLKDS